MGVTRLEDVSLIDLVDLSIITDMQNVFSELMGISVVIVDEEGDYITDWSGCSRYCSLISQESDLGCKLCGYCRKYGVKTAAAKADGVDRFYCHAGTVECSAVIRCQDKVVGAVLSGQITTAPLSEEKVELIAEELSLDMETLWKAAQAEQVKGFDEIERIARSVKTMASIISRLITSRFEAMQVNADIVSAGAAKQDFLANMSHEIRTPMNAIIGMSEMALREQLPDTAREYIEQIKNSGRALLTLINDILDYSKVEAGKMELSEVEYEPLSLIHDVSNIIMTRVNDKPVELLLDCDPNLPYKLYGDDLRIRQVLINVANNATKFTNEGFVQVKVRFEQKNSDTIILKVAVKDTGIGIKDEDKEKLFNSFSQVDSKRNRNVEGSGLGLAIVKRILDLMGGEITVESVYGEGSTFTISVEQKVVDSQPSISLDNPEQYVVAGFFVRDDVRMDFQDDAAKLGVHTSVFSKSENPIETLKGWCVRHKDQQRFVLFEQKYFENLDISSFDAELRSKINVVILAEAFADVREWKDDPTLSVIKKPFSVLNLATLLNSDAVKYSSVEAVGEDTAFEAPTANILIVDDNAINLTVAEGLLEPLKMNIDTALSGNIALEKIAEKRYDIVFMDHMMPELDGVETTRIIRRLHPELDDMPVIALTANAVAGTKEMFLDEGMNDFVAKPIELKILMQKVRQWLPDEKIEKPSAIENPNEATEVKQVEIPDEIGDLDVAAAVGLVGSKPLFFKILKDYYKAIAKKADSIKAMYDASDWIPYTIEVHALKSASKQIGAMWLSERAALLEKAGNERDEKYIRENTDEALEKYRSYISVLAPLFEENTESDADKEEISDDKLKEYLGRLDEACENLDMDEMEAIVTELNGYAFPDATKEKFESLKEAAENIDVDTCQELIKNWF